MVPLRAEIVPSAVAKMKFAVTPAAGAKAPAVALSTIPVHFPFGVVRLAGGATGTTMVVTTASSPVVVAFV